MQVLTRHKNRQQAMNGLLPVLLYYYLIESFKKINEDNLMQS